MCFYRQDDVSELLGNFGTKIKQAMKVQTKMWPIITSSPVEQKDPP